MATSPQRLRTGQVERLFLDFSPLFLTSPPSPMSPPTPNDSWAQCWVGLAEETRAHTAPRAALLLHRETLYFLRGLWEAESQGAVHAS